MRIERHVETGQWLVDRAGRWATVGGVAGTGFEAYARILHPVDGQRFDTSLTDERGWHPTLESRSWRWSDVAARTGRTMHPLVQWDRLTRGEQYLTFSDGWELEQSQEGWFDPRHMAVLSGHLRADESDLDIVVGIWDGWGVDGGLEWVRGPNASAPLLRWPGRDFALLRGSLSELANPGWGLAAGIGWAPGSEWSGWNHHPSPQLIWPDNRSWVVATEIDWNFTIVAGPRPLVDAVLADDRFETFEVAEDDDLSLAGDVINPP